MSDEISQALKSYIHQEERLLAQLSKIHGQRKDIRTELGKEVVSIGAREVFGRTGARARPVRDGSWSTVLRAFPIASPTKPTTK